MDRIFLLGGVRFVWDEAKAAWNISKHGIGFEKAAEIFLDPMVRYADASVDEEDRTAAVGRSFNHLLLFVVHIEREDDVIRIISARMAEPKESASYQNRRGDL